MTENPIIATVSRGSLIESRHRGSFVVCDDAGKIIASAGNIEADIFPRSAVKVFQFLPLLAAGGVEAFGLSAEEIALCCSSHTGQAEHVRVAQSILAKAGIAEADYECGSQWPERMEDRAMLIRQGCEPAAVHNNCSGKHAGMLALAKLKGWPLKGYTDASHPVQKAVAATIDRYCGISTEKQPVGIDGCSVPTWALPLPRLAQGFAKLFAADNAHGQLIFKSVQAHPLLIAGTGKFDTKIMTAVPRLFIKFGAEAVFCGAIPHAGLGFALKVEDGAARAAEVAIAGVLAGLSCWTQNERESLEEFSHAVLKNWRKREVGETRANF